MSTAITRDDLRQFIARAIRSAAADGIGVTVNVHVRGEVKVDRDAGVFFELDDGGRVSIDPEWMVPRGYFGTD